MILWSPVVCRFDGGISRSRHTSLSCGGGRVSVIMRAQDASRRSLRGGPALLHFAVHADSDHITHCPCRLAGRPPRSPPTALSSPVTTGSTSSMLHAMAVPSTAPSLITTSSSSLAS
ncbi:hypothetical protein GUJ93_ZPchr0013g36924 [Zizania palustris]|uniref:Uncharacterized protein n=1 Tax=Zizania palustris TaxID=103762 RepID=A0A8J6BY29_ZIZPA|nr:hypothetical protein GUJ93_ZPchr0013g36924 [Zizania palustris]